MSRVQRTHSHVHIYCAHIWAYTCAQTDCTCAPHAHPSANRCLRGGHRHLDLQLHVDPLDFIIPPPSNRTTPSSSPTRPSGHDTHASTTRCTSSPGIVTYSQSLPLSAAAGVLPCCRRDLLLMLAPAATAVGAAQLPSRECVRAHGKG